MSKKILSRVLPLSLIIVALALSGCASASKMLEKAESAWAAGQYVTAIEYGLTSYEKAVDKNKDIDEISSARAFLEDHFSLANDYMLERAENQLNGSDSEKSEAWKTFESLVQMNRRVRDSIASSFLSTQDYSAQLQKAKEVAAQIKYVKALELMGHDKRSAYIEAWNILNEIDAFVPDYRDIGVLADECIIAGTVTVAISDRSLPFTVKEGNASHYPGMATDAYDQLKSYIISNDHPEFVAFVTAGSVKGATDLGAALFLEIQGDVWVASEIDNDYQRNGSVTWERSYGGTPVLVATRISDTRNEVASADLSLQQEVSIEFYIEKYSTYFLSDDLYNNQFGNVVWMTSQLNEAKQAMSQDDGEADMTVFAEMEYGGTVSFRMTAEMNDVENGGTKEVPIDSAVYSGTQQFINSTIPEFMAFEDLGLQERIVDEMTSAFLASSGVKELLGNLGD